LFVQTWQSKVWDATQHRFRQASGTGRLAFQCQAAIRLPFASTNLVDHSLTVVTVVQHPSREIALAEAQRLDSQAAVASTMIVQIPAGLVTDSQRANAVRTYIQWRLSLSGGMPVRFVDLTIAMTALPGVADVVSGRALYTAAGNAESAAFPLSGFSGLINTLTITPQAVSADVTLEMPASIVDAGTGHPGRAALGAIPVTRACEFQRELPTLAYGPWSVGNTGMEIKGTGVVADFDHLWSPSTIINGQPPTAAWKGVVLGSGTTLPETNALVVSNSGYVRAAYSYPTAHVVAAGVSANLGLTAPFRFQALEPSGYAIELTQGSIKLVDSAIRSGEFRNSTISAPRFAVGDQNGQPLTSKVDRLDLNDKLELVGTTQLPAGLSWGDFVSQPAPNGARYFRAWGFKTGTFYLSSAHRPNFAPLDSSDRFLAPAQPPCERASTLGMQGLTFCTPGNFEIDTPDTPGAVALRFVPGKEVLPNWVNIVTDGVHANISSFVSDTSTSLDLGPTRESYYVGKKAFTATSTGHASPQYSLDIKFVSSAVHGANMSGMVKLAQPIDGTVSFNQMQFTSTAQISGAQVPLDSPLPLSYWGVTLVRNAGATTGGVMSVRTGQIFVTAGGIAEPRHFVRPFFLTWGEILADGELGRLLYDYNAAGQRFDGFLFTPSYVKLSDYIARSSPTGPPYPNLRAAGNVSFDLFGARYVNVKDEYHTELPGPPNDSRLATLEDDVDPNGAYRASDHALNAPWSGDLAQFAFTYNYDANLQDGFIGNGTADFKWISGNLPASIALKSSQICITASDSSRHGVALGPFTSFLSVAELYGCGCIANGHLQRFGLGARLEIDPATSLIARNAASAAVQFDYKPTISKVIVQGDMLLTIVIVGNVEVSGSAVFAVERDQSAVSGVVDGTFDSSAMLGSSRLGASGRLDWHLAVPTATDRYQSLQGRASVRIIGPMDAAKVEGGFYVGLNAPRDKAWIITTASTRLRPSISALPSKLTGSYVYGKLGESLGNWVISGGVESYTGLGVFVGTAGLPTTIEQASAHAWGKILGGLGYASGWADLRLVGVPPSPVSFAGDLRLTACGAWLVCGTVELGIEISDDGLDVSW